MVRRAGVSLEVAVVGLFPPLFFFFLANPLVKYVACTLKEKKNDVDWSRFSLIWLVKNFMFP